jgi:hypothetical protein
VKFNLSFASEKGRRLSRDLVDGALAVPTNNNVTAILVELYDEKIIPTSSQSEQANLQL